MIVVVCYDLNRDNVGGVQNGMMRVLSGLIQYKYVVVFNLQIINPYMTNNKNALIKNYTSAENLNYELNLFLQNNDVEFVYFADYRHTINLKKKTTLVVAAVQDMDLFRSKYDINYSKKIIAEKKVSKQNVIDYLHVASKTHQMVCEKYFPNKRYIISPIGLKKDNYKYKKSKSIDSIVASRYVPYKNYDNIKELLKNKLIHSNYLVSNKYVRLPKTIYKKAKTYEEIIPLYKNAHLNINLSHNETFSNTLVEGAFYGCVPIIKPTNLLSFDLLGGKVLFDNEIKNVTPDKIRDLSKDIFKFSRKCFDLNNNIKTLLSEIK